MSSICIRCGGWDWWSAGVVMSLRVGGTGRVCAVKPEHVVGACLASVMRKWRLLGSVLLSTAMV